MIRNTQRPPYANDTLHDEETPDESDAVGFSAPATAPGDTLVDDDVRGREGERTIANNGRPRPTTRANSVSPGADLGATTLTLRDRDDEAHLATAAHEGATTLPLPPQHGEHHNDEAEIATMPLGFGSEGTATLQLEEPEHEPPAANTRLVSRTAAQPITPHADRTLPVAGSVASRTNDIVAEAPLSAPAVVNGRIVVPVVMPPAERVEDLAAAPPPGPARWLVVLGVVVVGSLLGWVIAQFLR